MTIEELRKRKKELGYTNAMIAEKTGLSVGAVQKLFSGETSSPRYDTVMKVKELLSSYPEKAADGGRVREPARSYYTDNRRAGEGSADAAVKKKAGAYGKRKVVISRSVMLDDADIERWPRQGGYTLDDYYALPDDIRVELIDGVIYDMAAPSGIHQTIDAEIWARFRECIKKHDMPCRAFIAPFDVRLDRDDRTIVQPDVLVLCHPVGSIQRIDGAPEFVAEVLSPSTRRKDLTVKLEKYAEAGVMEYWIIDPENEKVMVYDFDSGKYPVFYDFTEKVPVGISGGLCEIDFEEIKREVDAMAGLFTCLE